MNRILNTNLLALLIGLSACSPGDEDSDDDNQSVTDYREISISEAEAIDLTGTWKQSAEYHINAPISAILDSAEGFDINVNFSGSATSPVTISHDDNGNIISKDCDIEPADIETPKEFWINDDDLFDEDAESICESAFEYQVFQKTNDELLVRIGCEGNTLFDLKLERISQTPKFNHGSLSLSGNDINDISASDGVCVEIGDVSTTFSGPDLTKEMQDFNSLYSNIDIVAPYHGELISLSINIDDLAHPGTFTINETENITLEIASNGFDSLSTYYYAESGTVTLTVFTETHAKGEFDVLLNSGEMLSGNFDVSL